MNNKANHGQFVRKGAARHVTEMRTEGVDIRLLMAEFAGTFVVFSLALFIPAGTIKWIAGWIFLILHLADQ